MRWLICLLLSLDTHVLVLAGLALEPEHPRPRQPLEIELLRLVPPAPRAGKPVSIPAERPPPPDSRPRRRPRVTMKVTRSKAPQPVTPARRVALPPHHVAAVVEPLPHAAPYRPSARQSAAGGTTTHLASSLATVPLPAFPAVREPARYREPGGDTRPLVEIIQARIDAVTPLVSASNHCPEASGTVRLAFVVSPRGYHVTHRLEQPPSPCLERELEVVLHLAEPYPFVAGWVPVRVRFSP